MSNILSTYRLENHWFKQRPTNLLARNVGRRAMDDGGFLMKLPQAWDDDVFR
jgi:hypothetical protein